MRYKGESVQPVGFELRRTNTAIRFETKYQNNTNTDISLSGRILEIDNQVSHIFLVYSDGSVGQISREGE